jgi:hypothetical protein
MKKKIIVIAGLFLIFSVTLSISIDKKQNLSETPDKFKKDMLESIMEFSDEKTPADSLYIPEWLKPNIQDF